MKIKSTDIVRFMNRCFYLSFIDSKDYKTDVKRFIQASDDEMKFMLCDFIDNLNSEKKETFGLVPTEVFSEVECPKSLLRKIEKEYLHSNQSGGFTRVFMEYLFDERFKKELNQIVKVKFIADDSVKKAKNYFVTKETAGEFTYDLVGIYLDKIKDSFYFESNDLIWDFSDITERKAVRGTKHEKVDLNGTEKLDNVYSAFKIFGQGEYSKILISVLDQNKKNIVWKEPTKSSTNVNDIIITDDKISGAVPKCILDRSDISFVEERIFERQLKYIILQLQRFFDDYVPSDLDRVYVMSGKNRGNTLREDLIIKFKSIAKEEWSLYKSIKANSDAEKNDIYERLSRNRNLFSISEVNFIYKNYDEYAENNNAYNPLAEKIKYLKKLNLPKLNKSTRWKTILEKYNEYFPASLDSYEEINGNHNDILEDKKYLNAEEIMLRNESPSQKVIELFEKYFMAEKQFLSALESDINLIESFNAQDFFFKLKGDRKHPWSRFWSVYGRNSEIGLYKVQSDFTKVMNEIEVQAIKICKKYEE